jgi:pilus assembly protein FimV
MAIWGRRGRHSASTGEAEDIADTAVIPEPRPKTAALATSFVEEAEVYIAYGRLDQAIEVLNDAVSEGLASETVTLRLIDCYVDSGRVDEAWALLDQLARSVPPELLEQVRERLVDAGASSVIAAGSAPELEQVDAQRSEAELSEENTSLEVAVSGATSGLSLAPIDAATEDEPAAGEEHAAIYGSETDPMDSQLDLARAYIDMGDDEGARPVLMSVIKEGDLSQQAQARELLLRIEVT